MIVPEPALHHALPAVTAARRVPLSSLNAARPLNVLGPSSNTPTTASPSTVHLNPSSTHLWHLPLAQYTICTDPDLPRHVASPIALTVTDILSRLSPLPQPIR